MKMVSARVLLLWSALMLTLALGSSGCRLLKKKSEAAPSATVAVTVSPPAPTPPAPPPTTAATAAAVATVNVPDEAIATTEDYEDEAFAKVSDKTYKTDLEALKKEIETP